MAMPKLQKLERELATGGATGLPISRSEALRIASKTRERAEQERLAIVEEEASKGIQVEQKMNYPSAMGAEIEQQRGELLRLYEENETLRQQLAQAQQEIEYLRRRDVLQRRLIRALEEVSSWHALQRRAIAPVLLLDEVIAARGRLAALGKGDEEEGE